MFTHTHVLVFRDLTNDYRKFIIFGILNEFLRYRSFHMLQCS
jgi:hypothetical protein